MWPGSVPECFLLISLSYVLGILLEDVLRIFADLGLHMHLRDPVSI